jgi:hypothetical protein
MERNMPLLHAEAYYAEGGAKRLAHISLACCQVLRIKYQSDILNEMPPESYKPKSKG